MKRLRIILCLLANAMLLGVLLLVYLDGRNPLMLFLNSTPSKIFLVICCVLGLLVSILSTADQYRDKK